MRLTFEFKKLKDSHASRKAYYGRDGMLRFVQNKYGREQPIGVMVGILNSPLSVCPAKLTQALGKSDIVASLSVIQDATSRVVRNPSAQFAGVAAFDTHHTRVSGKLIMVILAHLMLPFP